MVIVQYSQSVVNEKCKSNEFASLISSPLQWDRLVHVKHASLFSISSALIDDIKVWLTWDSMPCNIRGTCLLTEQLNFPEFISLIKSKA